MKKKSVHVCTIDQKTSTVHRTILHYVAPNIAPSTNTVCQAFLQLNFHRLVFQGQLLVIDVEDRLLTSAEWTPKFCTMKLNQIENLVKPQGSTLDTGHHIFGNVSTPTKSHCHNLSGLPDSMMNSYFAFFASPQVTLMYLVLTSSRTNVLVRCMSLRLLSHRLISRS